MNGRKLKKIKEQAKVAEKLILDRNKDFYDDFIKTNYPKKERKNTVKILSFAAVASIVLTVILCLVFLLPSSSNPNPTPNIPVVPEDPPITPEPPPKYYLLENEKMHDSDVISAMSELRGFTLIVSSNYNVSVRRIYDSEYDDTLYYWLTLECNNTFETISIYLYVNPNYKSQKILDFDSKAKILGDIAFSYIELKENIADGIITFTYKAKTDINNMGQTIYIEYNQVSFDGESAFFNFFEQTIKKDS